MKKLAALLVVCILGAVLLSCSRKREVAAQDVCGTWAAVQNAKATISLEPNGTVRLAHMPNYIYNGNALDKTFSSRNGKWKLNYAPNSEGIDAYIDLYLEPDTSGDPQYSLAVLKKKRGVTLFFLLGDPDEMKTYAFRKLPSR